MDYAEKLYLVPQRQLDSLKNNEPPIPLRQSVENELDTSINNVLSRTDLDQHEKAKLYTGLLQRYLALVKQGAVETNALTLNLPQTSVNSDPVTPLTPQTTDSDVGGDVMVEEILRNIPMQRRKNAQYILEKMLNAQDTARWRETGEFVFNGSVIPGTHIFDLVKSATAPQMTRRRPQGWDEFLRAIAKLNIPLSTVPNRQVQQAVDSLKRTDAPTLSTPVRGLATTDFLSQGVDNSPWISF